MINPGFGIAIHGCSDLVINNIQVQLQNVKTSVIISGNAIKVTNLNMYNSNFTGNRNAHSTSVVFFQDMTLGNFFISNCYFTNNSNALSVITVKNSVLSFTHCTISDNNMTGITILERGAVLFEEWNKIQNNRASEGAGIKLLPNAQINIDGILWVNDNIAYQGPGGGIYQITNFQIPYASDSLNFFDKCAITCDTGKINFSGNRATKGGSDAYGLKSCKLSPMEIELSPTIHLVECFHFNDTDPLSSVSTDPVMVCFCNTSSHPEQLPQCSERTHYTSAYPGMEINATIATLGHYNGTSPGTVLVNVGNATVVH